MITGHQMRPHPDSSQKRVISPQEDYQLQLVMLEEQNRLRHARWEQVKASRGSTAETPAQPNNGPHALQGPQSVPLMREAQNEGQTAIALTQVTETPGKSSNKTLAQYGNNNSHAGAQKRKKGNNDEGRVITPV